MKKSILFYVFIVLFLSIPNGYAQSYWKNISKGLDGIDFQTVAIHPKDPKIIFAGAGRYLYRTLDGGASWKRVFSLRGSDASIRFLYADLSDSQKIYAGTDKGLYRSVDGGRQWGLYFKGIGEASKRVYAIASSNHDPSALWIGTGQGLFLMNTRENKVHKVDGFPNIEVYSILLPHNGKEDIFVTTKQGIYRGEGRVSAWKRVFSKLDSELKIEETSLEQFQIEEISTAPFFGNLIFLPSQNKYYASSAEGILEGTVRGRFWNPLDGQSLPQLEVHSIARSPETFYAATDQGVFRWDFESSSFEEVYQGLISKKIRMIAYSGLGDYLVIVTKKGIYQLNHPHLNFSSKEGEKSIFLHPDEVLNTFETEPSIHQIQNAAIQYAEVHPEKIQKWRAAAWKKAYWPTVSLTTGGDRDEVVELDRGGTGDPDTFIVGPNESSLDWSVSIKWDLADIVWSGDQTTIDVRARLMVELRDDILNEVTHLYFERRRLQVEIILAVTQDLTTQIEKQIRLQELTARIDGLTGGYLSRSLVQAGKY